MDHKQFQEWLSGIDHLSPAQRQQTEAVFLGDTETSASLAAIEAAVGEDRQCPHCGTPGAISRGKARGLRRYQCKECRKTFNAATGTPLSGLHRKDKWLSFGACLADGLTVRASAERCGLAVNTALRWRHRFLAAKDLKARKLTGIVEADETYVLESRKGARNLERKARRRGGKASKRGLSDEQVPVLVVADRGGATVSAVLPAVNADTLREVIAPVVDEDIVLVTDGHRADPRCAAAIGAHHEALNLSRSERVRGAFHIQIAADPAVNNRHGRLKDFLRRYRGVATRYLDNYLRWFQRLELENASPRACLATAIARPCIQFETEPTFFLTPVNPSAFRTGSFDCIAELQCNRFMPFSGMSRARMLCSVDWRISNGFVHGEIVKRCFSVRGHLTLTGNSDRVD